MLPVSILNRIQEDPDLKHVGMTAKDENATLPNPVSLFAAISYIATAPIPQFVAWLAHSTAFLEDSTRGRTFR